MYQQRQRAAAVLTLVGLLALGTACEARSSVEAAQTAVVAAQTAVTTAGPVVAALQALLQGIPVQVRTTPDGAPPQSVTGVDIDGTDAQGTLRGVDARARQAAAQAALQAAAHYYPNAAITLIVKDANGATVVTGNIAPGQPPRVQ